MLRLTGEQGAGLGAHRAFPSLPEQRHCPVHPRRGRVGCLVTVEPTVVGIGQERTQLCVLLFKRAQPLDFRQQRWDVLTSAGRELRIGTARLEIISPLRSDATLIRIWPYAHHAHFIRWSILIRAPRPHISVKARPRPRRRLLGSLAYRRQRSEERRVGKECRSRWSPYH